MKTEELVGASPSFDYDMYQYREDQSKPSTEATDTGRASTLKIQTQAGIG